MAQPEVVLSVQVPEDNEEENHAELDMDQENEEPKVSLGVQNEADEETQRTKYGLNSPKRKKKETDLDDEEDDDGAMTPATKLRQTAGINSPKQQKTMTWGNTEENDNNNALAGVITQVQQTDNQPPAGGAQSIITQVSRENPITPMNTVDAYTREDEKTSDKTQQTNGGICACLSTLFTCCSNPSATEQRAIQQINSQSRDNNVPKDPPPVTSVDSASKEMVTQQEDKESSHSESSTVYDSALLPPLSPENKGKRCLVLDLDETLVHSSFKPVSNCDFIIPVEIDGVVHRVYVLKRPYVDQFLLECSKSYELVIFTASLSKYADPLLDQLDIHNVIAHRLFRESCTLHGSAYVKDMRRLGRRLKDTIFVDNSPHSYAFQPKNAVPIASWFDDPTDTQLRDFLPVLNTTLLQVKDVRHVLDAHNKRFSWLCRQANVDISKFES